MFKSINREINQIINRGFDRTLRLAVTGLSRSGKTAFITSLINQIVTYLIKRKMFISLYLRLPEINLFWP